jgi:SAM-dependent methyltransferase
MPQKPKIFKRGDQLYDVPESEVQDFLKEVPDAVEINVYEKDGQTFDVPLNELDAFMQEVPGATLVEGSKKKVSTPDSDITKGGPGRSSMGLSPLPPTVGKAIIDGEPERDPILKKAAEKSPWLAAPINFLTGAVKGTGSHIMKPLDGAQKLFYKGIGSLMEMSNNPAIMAEGIRLKAQQDDPKHMSWFKQAEWGIDNYATERLPEPIKEDFFSALVYNLGELAPFMGTLAVTPNPSLFGVGTRLPLNIGGQSAMSTYSETGDLGKAVREGAIGLGDGAALMLMGYGAGKAGQWITKGLSNQLGASAGVVGATAATGSMYGGGVSFNVTKQLINGTKWEDLDWDAANQEGALFFALGVPGIVNAAASTYAQAPKESIARARMMDVDVNTARERVFELFEKAEKETNPDKKTEYIVAAEAINKLADIKAMEEYFGKNAEQAIKDIKESNIPEADKKVFIERIEESRLYQEQIKEAEAKREEARGDTELKIEETEGGKFTVRQEGTNEAPEFATRAEAESFKEKFETITGKGMEFKEKKRLDAEDVAAGKKKKIEPEVTKVEKDAVQEPKAEKVDVEKPSDPEQQKQEYEKAHMDYEISRRGGKPPSDNVIVKPEDSKSLLDRVKKAKGYFAENMKGVIDKHFLFPIRRSLGGYDKNRIEYGYLPKPNENTGIRIKYRDYDEAKQWPEPVIYDKRVVNERGEVINDKYEKYDREYNDKISRETDPDHLFRGMSGEEFASVKKSGKIESDKRMNLGGQENITSFSQYPSQAHNYAHGFTAWWDMPTFDTPRYVVKVKRTGVDYDINRVGEAEVKGSVPTENIVDVWEIRLAEATPGKVEVVETYEGGIGEGKPSKEVGKEKPQAKEEVKPQELAKEYNERISKVKEETPDQMWSVDKPSEADIVEAAKGDRIVKGDGGMVMVKPDGDIVGLFKDTPGKKGVADQLMKDAVAKGGTKLDNFDGYLTKIYERNGFKVASRIPFDPAQAPKDMPAAEIAKKPDVVFMVHDPAGKIPAEQLNRKFESYEDAMKHRDAMVPEKGTGKQNEAFFTEKAAKASSDVPYEPVIKIDKETPTAKAYDTYSAGGNFTGHISKMIPGFQEKQIRVAEAINKTGAKSFLDIGASEGGLAKTVGSQNPDMRVVAVDPNSQMKKNFESTPEVKNVEFRQEAFQGSWTEADGTKINEFKPKEKFDVINEDFTFQFVNADRAKQVAGVKEMLAEDGVFITSEKFHTANKKANEAKKAEHQKKYFTEQERMADAEGIVTGMAKDMVKDVEYFEILKDNFKHVEEFWNAGEFKGFVASDSRPALEKFKKGVGDLTTEFTDPVSQTAAGAPPAKVPPKPPKPPEKPGELPGPEGKPERDVMDSLKEMRKERKAAMKRRKEIASNRPSYLWYDQQEPFKRDVLGRAKMAGRGKLEAQRVSDRLNTEKGAKARTAMEFARDLKEITGGIRGIGPKEMDLVSDIIDMRRTQELYKSREAFGKEELLMEGGVTLKQAEDFLTRVKKKDPAILEEYGLKDYDPKKLRKASEVVNRMYRENILDELLAEGIIRQEAYDQITFEHPFYSPRKFFDAMDKMDPGGSMSGIESLKGGSEGAKMVDAPSLYFDALSRKNAMVARTRTMRAIENYIKEVAPENMKLAEYTPEFLEKMNNAKEGDPWIEPQFKDAPKGMEAVDYIDINGNRKRVFMDAEVYKYFQVEPYGDMTRKIMNWAGWISGTKPLKMAATGYNPEFMIKNVPIDIAHILMTTDIYSPILPVGVAQIHADMAKVAKDMVNRKGVYVDYINEGGGMKMLTGQGRLREGVSRQKLKKTTQAAEAIEGWAAWMGESSELLTRLSVRQRHLDKARSRFIKENGREPSAKEQKELQLDATAYARNYLDFEQGGRVIKMADSVIPYLNAGFQVTRGSLRAAGKNPGLYAAKVAQLAGTAAAITAWNMGMIQTDNIDEEKGAEMRRFYLNDISDEVKARNFVLMTPMKYIDANGVEKYVYFKFQKDNLQELITGVAEDRVHREVMGDLGPSYLSPRRIKELQVATESFANVSQLPPAVRGMLGYKLNKDFFYNSDLWMGYDMGRDKSLEYRRDTPERYKFVGKIPLPGGHKLSPTRSHYVAKQFFTESNVISTGIGELMDYAIKGASPEMTTEYTPGEVEKLKNAPFARRFLKSTYPGASKQGSDTYQQQYNRIKQDNNLALDNLIDKKASPEEVEEWIVSIYTQGDGDITYIKEGDRLMRRYQEEVLMPAVNSWVERLKYIDAVPRAQELFDQWVHMDDRMRQHLLESAVMAGVLSDDVVVKFQQLQQEYESEYQKMEAERSKEQPETKKPRPKRSSFAPDLPSVKDVKGVDVEIDVEIEETGKTERMSMSAVEVRKDIKRRYDAINELIKSIG